jgi:sigma-B regulation protein RsbU (phosphoserine phosphatase)
VTDWQSPPDAPLDVADAFYAALVNDDPAELYDAAPCAYLSALPDGTLAKVNATFLSWTGYRRDELIGRRRLQDLLPPGDRIFYETHLAPALRLQGQVREITVDIVCRSGRRLPVLVNAVFQRDAAGTSMIRAAILDATERRAYERELLAARQRAEVSEARARALAQTLQQTFLPPVMPSVPGVDIAGAYRPAGDGAEVGGDFYDVFYTGGGRWAVVLGDVCGKGAAAAVLTAFARHTVRAEAVHTPAPSTVLAALHTAMLRYHPDQFCTILFLTLERRDDHVRLTVATGGHQLPVRRRPDGTFDRLGATGTLIGMVTTSHIPESATALTSGDLVVLYTDGVTEARRAGGEFFGDGRLRAAIAAAAGTSAQEVADRIVTASVDFQDGHPRDDIAVVVFRAA